MAVDMEHAGHAFLSRGWRQTLLNDNGSYSFWVQEAASMSFLVVVHMVIPPSQGMELLVPLA